LLAGLELDALLGVHLPDLVRCPRPLRIHPGATAGRGGPQARRVKPPLQCPLARELLGGMGPAEDHPDQAGAPGRMTLAQSQAVLPHRVGEGRRGDRVAMVGRGQRGSAAALEAADELPHGARSEVEGRGDGRGGLTALRAMPDRLPEGKGQWPGHESTSRIGSPRRTRLSHR